MDAAMAEAALRRIDRLGLQLSGRVTAIEPRDLWPAMRAGWAHDYADLSGSLTASFLGKPDASFTPIGTSVGIPPVGLERPCGRLPMFAARRCVQGSPSHQHRKEVIP
jgi:hypothetical protein